MNLVLLERNELHGGSRVHLSDHRAEHLIRVLKAEPGTPVRVGILEGPLGLGEVRSIDASGVTLDCRFEDETPPRPEDALLLAFARPNILLRVFEHAAALGFGKIVIFRTRLVDRSHVLSRITDPSVHLPRLRQGLEQARRTQMPEIHFFDRFLPFVEDALDELVAASGRILAHPEAERTLAELELATARPFTVAIGPERGFTDHEVEKFTAHGFTPVAFGPHPLRVETACTVAHASLSLVRERPLQGEPEVPPSRIDSALDPNP